MKEYDELKNKYKVAVNSLKSCRVSLLVTAKYLKNQIRTPADREVYNAAMELVEATRDDLVSLGEYERKDNNTIPFNEQLKIMKMIKHKLTYQDFTEILDPDIKPGDKIDSRFVNLFDAAKRIESFWKKNV